MISCDMMAGMECNHDMMAGMECDRDMTSCCQCSAMNKLRNFHFGNKVSVVCTVTEAITSTRSTKL